MSVSSIDPIVDSIARNMNRTESFNDMVMEEANVRNRGKEVTFIKRGMLSMFIIIIILCFCSFKNTYTYSE